MADNQEFKISLVAALALVGTVTSVASCAKHCSEQHRLECETVLKIKPDDARLIDKVCGKTDG